MSTFFELGKDKAAKGEGWAPLFISGAQETVELLTPPHTHTHSAPPLSIAATAIRL